MYYIREIDKEKNMKSQTLISNFNQKLEDTFTNSDVYYIAQAFFETVAQPLGWEVGSCQVAQTGTTYLSVYKHYDHEDDFLEKELKIRFSDHGACYCREDFSLVFGGSPNPDDHDINTVIEALSRDYLQELIEEL